MCTVAVVPLAGEGYLLGHNRDERRSRARGFPPERHERAGKAFVAPSDPDGGGTWIGVNDSGMTLCLLNAVEPDPSRLPRQPESRGRVLWSLLHSEAAGDVASGLSAVRAELQTIRAFHLVAVEPARGRGDARTVRWRWDGQVLDREEHESPLLFVSSSLAQEGIGRAREAAWKDLLSRVPLPDRQALGEWLASHVPERGPLSVCMHRPEARTVSRTMVSVTADRIEMVYHDGSPCDASAPEYLIRL